MYKDTGYKFSEDDYFALKGFFDEGFIERDKIYTAAEIKNMKKYAPIRLEEIFEISEYFAVRGLVNEEDFEPTPYTAARIKKMKQDALARLEEIFSGFDDAE